MKSVLAVLQHDVVQALLVGFPRVMLLVELLAQKWHRLFETRLWKHPPYTSAIKTQDHRWR